VDNTAIGAGALAMNTANYNTATGFEALFSNKTGSRNTANGINALLFNQVGSSNTAIGTNALYRNTASYNTAIGDSALFSNVNGTGNTATGFKALFSNTTVGALSGDDNTAIGDSALFNNMTGFTNTAIGFDALGSNTIGNANTAVGFDALVVNDHGFANTAVGNAALANSTGDGNTALGASAGLGVHTASNVIVIGTGGSDVVSSCFIGNIRGVTTAVADAIPVFIDSAHQLGTMSSSRRFKREIQPIDKASEAILALKPVSFRYKIHKDTTPQFGLIAEEVAEVNPDLVIYDADGKPYTVRYDAVNAMLLNEFLKEHRKVEQMEKQIEALTAGLQKVSAQLEVGKSAPQTVLNDQ
jgi:hypothetical protein